MIASDNVSTLVRTPSPVGTCRPPTGVRMPSTRVLHLINGDLYSGAERVQDLLARCLPERGFEVGFACLKSGQFARMRQSRRAALHSIPMRHPLDLSAAWTLVHLIRGAGYRLIHAHTPRTVWIGRLAAHTAGVPLVYHVHSPAVRESTHWLRNRIRGCVEQWGLGAAERLITVSRSLSDQMIGQGIAAERVCHVPNGVPRIDRPRGRSRPNGVWTLGTVALYRPRKGLEVLLHALAQLGRAMPGRFRLRAVGPFESPAYRTHIKQLAASLGLAPHIEWVGFSRDVPRELARMDLFVLPSLFGEGLPMVVLESMAAGVPVVASRVEGTPEAIRDGRDGLLVPPGDSTALAGAIDEVISGRVDWCNLQASALRRHAARFSVQAMADGVAGVYRDVLGMA